MTDRDHYAIAAMQSLLGANHRAYAVRLGKPNLESLEEAFFSEVAWIAQDAFAIADMMLQERDDPSN